MGDRSRREIGAKQIVPERERHAVAPRPTVSGRAGGRGFDKMCRVPDKPCQGFRHQVEPGDSPSKLLGSVTHLQITLSFMK